MITPEMVGLGDNALLDELQRKVYSFENRFRLNKRVHMVIWEVAFLNLDRYEADSLEVLFGEDKIRRELMDMDRE